MTSTTSTTSTTSMMFKSADGRATQQQWHRRFRDLVVARAGDGVSIESRTVDTTWGETHVLVGGPADGAPLVLLHGAMASSSHVLAELVPLLSTYRVHAVDILGQSAMSADMRLPVDDDSHGRWLAAVMDGLGLASAHIVGVSWGGFVALRLAATAAERVDALVLLVPAGLVTGSAWEGITKMGWPMFRYLSKPTPERLRALAANLLSSVDDDNWRDSVGDAFRTARLGTMKVPTLATTAEFKGFQRPVLVIAADEDVSFPGDKVIARARVLFGDAVDTELLRGCKHSPPTTDAFRAFLSERLLAFLATA
jgi:2-hydroxy-6-oxonona-2,4-dienedioate hydrolase